MNQIKDWIEDKKESFSISAVDKNKFYILFLLAAIIAGGFFLLSRGVFSSSIPIAAANSLPNVNATTSDNSSQSSLGNIYVYVSGKVHKPGLYQLPKGARVDDALKAANGALNGVDLTYLNLAQGLIDGEQIIVSNSPQIVAGSQSSDPTANTSNTALSSSPSKSQGSKTKGAGASKKKALPTSPINLNTATQNQLEQLPGVGPAMASKILAYRKSLGRFTNINQLQNISGMGPAHYKKIQAYVRIS